MSLDRVQGISDLPLFPLAVVLFPGVPLPLHIFESRYRQLFRDVNAGNKLFGVSFFDAEKSELDVPPAGHPGCVAEVTDVQTLPDGRMNIMTVGLVRYHVDSYIERDDPYLVGKVSFFEDEPEEVEELLALSRRVGEVFSRIAAAVNKMNDQRTPLAELPNDEPERLSFLMAGAMDIEDEQKLELLEMRSTSMRLGILHELLSRAVEGYEQRAGVHAAAKLNGHAGKKINLK